MSSSLFSNLFQERSKLTDLTTLPAINILTTFFLLIWSWMKKYVAGNGPIPKARSVLHVHNMIYATFSYGMVVAIARSVLLGEEGKQLGEYCRYAYHFSKFYEYLDVLLLLASGGSVGQYMAFYHITNPILSYFRILHASDWQLFIFLTCLHQALLYSYLSGTTHLKVLLPFTQYLQLGGGILVDFVYIVLNGTGNKDEVIARTVCVLLLLKCAQLYTKSQRAESQKSAKATTTVDESPEAPQRPKASKTAKSEGKKRR